MESSTFIEQLASHWLKQPSPSLRAAQEHFTTALLGTLRDTDSRPPPLSPLSFTLPHRMALSLSLEHLMTCTTFTSAHLQSLLHSLGFHTLQHALYSHIDMTTLLSMRHHLQTSSYRQWQQVSGNRREEHSINDPSRTQRQPSLLMCLMTVLLSTPNDQRGHTPIPTLSPTPTPSPPPAERQLSLEDKLAALDVEAERRDGSKGTSSLDASVLQRMEQQIEARVQEIREKEMKWIEKHERALYQQALQQNTESLHSSYQEQLSSLQERELKLRFEVEQMHADIEIERRRIAVQEQACQESESRTQKKQMRLDSLIEQAEGKMREIQHRLSISTPSPSALMTQEREQALLRHISALEHQTASIQRQKEEEVTALQQLLREAEATVWRERQRERMSPPSNVRDEEERRERIREKDREREREKEKYMERAREQELQFIDQQQRLKEEHHAQMVQLSHEWKDAYDALTFEFERLSDEKLQVERERDEAKRDRTRDQAFEEERQIKLFARRSSFDSPSSLVRSSRRRSRSSSKEPSLHRTSSKKKDKYRNASVLVTEEENSSLNTDDKENSTLRTPLSYSNRAQATFSSSPISFPMLSTPLSGDDLELTLTEEEVRQHAIDRVKRARADALMSSPLSFSVDSTPLKRERDEAAQRVKAEREWMLKQHWFNQHDNRRIIFDEKELVKQNEDLVQRESAKSTDIRSQEQDNVTQGTVEKNPVSEEQRNEERYKAKRLEDACKALEEDAKHRTDEEEERLNLQRQKKTAKEQEDMAGMLQIEEKDKGNGEMDKCVIEKQKQEQELALHSKLLQDEKKREEKQKQADEEEKKAEQEKRSKMEREASKQDQEEQDRVEQQQIAERERKEREEILALRAKATSRPSSRSKKREEAKERKSQEEIEEEERYELELRKRLERKSTTANASLSIASLTPQTQPQTEAQRRMAELLQQAKDRRINEQEKEQVAIIKVAVSPLDQTMLEEECELELTQEIE